MTVGKVKDFDFKSGKMTKGFAMGGSANCYAKGGKAMEKASSAPQGMIKNRGTLGVMGCSINLVNLDAIASQIKRIWIERRNVNFQNSGFTCAIRNVSKLGNEQALTVKYRLRGYCICHVYLLSVSLKIQGQALDEY